MEEETVRRVGELLEKGMSYRQIAKELDISKSSVERAVEQLKQRASMDASAGEERLKELVRQEVERIKDSEESPQDGLPVVRKTGQGMEVINPEAVLKAYLLQDGEPGMWMLRGAMLLRAAQLMVMEDVAIMKGQAEAHAKLMEPVLKLMKETREEQDAAAARARDSSLEMAREAAQEALGRAMPYLDERLKEVEAAVQKKPDIASTPHPLQGVMARTMETLMNRLLAVFGVGSQPGQEGERGLPGFTYQKVGQSPQPVERSNSHG